MSFKLVSYNILAPEFALSERYPNVDPIFAGSPYLGNWEHREECIIKHVLSYDADLILLQEVNRTFKMQGGYTKGSSKPNGYLAIGEGVSVEGYRGPFGKRCAQLVRYRNLLIANCHLSWDAEGKKALAELKELAAKGCDLICGDFNVTENSEAIEWLCKNGYSYAYRGVEQPTFLDMVKIDFICHRDGFTARPIPIDQMEPTDRMPSERHPSDHRLIAAEIEIN